ncbi:MAG: MinD/ParA family protein [Syntrophobacteraceae bacterium]
MDQADGLRERREEPHQRVNYSAELILPQQQPPVRVITVSSGKGGVGKSNIVVNLAFAFDRLGKKVLIMDADLGLANIDILLGLTPKRNISHVLSGKTPLKDVLVKGPGEIRIMPASSGVQELTRLSNEQKLLFLEMLDEFESEFDVLLVDTGAGISDLVLYFNIAAQERMVVVTPEPTSLTDAYALIKVLYSRHGVRHFRIVTNNVSDAKAGKAIFAQISKVADHFLDGISLDYLGSIPHDSSVPRSVIKQRPFLETFPEAPASKAVLALAERIWKSPPPVDNGTVQFFWKRLLQL